MGNAPPRQLRSARSLPGIYTRERTGVTTSPIRRSPAGNGGAPIDDSLQRSVSRPADSEQGVERPHIFLWLAPSAPRCDMLVRVSDDSAFDCAMHASGSGLNAISGRRH